MLNLFFVLSYHRLTTLTMFNHTEVLFNSLARELNSIISNIHIKAVNVM